MFGPAATVAEGEQLAKHWPISVALGRLQRRNSTGTRPLMSRDEGRDTLSCGRLPEKQFGDLGVLRPGARSESVFARRFIADDRSGGMR